MSVSSYVLSSITSFRNLNGPEEEGRRVVDKKANSLKLVAAEIGYIVAIPFAVIETAIAAIAKLFSICLPIGQENHGKMTAWLDSSAFSIIWAAVGSAINLFRNNDLIETEGGVRDSVARYILDVPLSEASTERNA